MFNPYIWVLFIGHLVVDLGGGILPVLMPLLAQNFNLSYFQIGTVALAYSISSAVIQPVFGVFSDRHSMPWLMPLGLFLSGIGLALTGTVNSYGLLLLAVLVSGIGSAGFHPEGSKVVYYVSEENKAGSSMAVFSLGGNIGIACGPILAVFVLSFNGLDSVRAVMIPGIIAGAGFLYLLPRFKKIIIANSAKQKKRVVHTAGGGDKFSRIIPLTLYVITRSWVHAGLIYFIPFYFPAYKGIAEPEYFITIFLVAGAIGTLLGGFFADRFGGRNGLLVSMLLTLLTVYPFIHLDGFWLPVLAFIAGASLISTFSTTVVFGQRLLPNHIGLASGLMLGFSVGMGSVGVSLLGAVADRLGLPFIMNVICLLPMLGIILAFTLPDIRAGGVDSKQGEVLPEQA